MSSPVLPPLAAGAAFAETSKDNGKIYAFTDKRMRLRVMPATKTSPLTVVDDFRPYERMSPEGKVAGLEGKLIMSGAAPEVVEYFDNLAAELKRRIPALGDKKHVPLVDDEGTFMVKLVWNPDVFHNAEGKRMRLEPADLRGSDLVPIIDVTGVYATETNWYITAQVTDGVIFRKGGGVSRLLASLFG